MLRSGPHLMAGPSRWSESFREEQPGGIVVAVLLQHADSPVDSWPSCDEASEQASLGALGSPSHTHRHLFD